MNVHDDGSGSGGAEIEDNETTPLVQSDKLLSKKQERKARIQFLALCWSLFVLGWTDGTVGPLLPRIQEFYDVGYATVSWIFVFGCTGIVFGALMNMPLTDKLGFGKMLVLGTFFQILAFTMQSFAPAFPIFVASFAIGGIGMAVQDAHANGFIALVRNNAETKMGFLHAAYGAGALAAPLSATQFSQMTHWSFHYLVSLSLSIINMVVLAIVFRFKEQDECLAQGGEIIPNKPENFAEEGKYGQLMRLKATHLLALFLLVYIGVEVTIGGWTVTFMMVVRGGGPSSGYIASGFFGGLTLGRLVLLGVNKKVNSALSACSRSNDFNPSWGKYVLYTYTLFSHFQLVVWLVPSFAVGTVAVCCIGSRVIPRSLVTGSIGWISACGAAGSALLPFLTGAIASKFGIASLQPLLVAMMILLGTLWVVVPKVPLST
ncbi:hypothetical protein M413DRAFT_20429 [Hebeloma cylindrosporum]|uniref:Major facilitator superfamily (MFS) profile domain-containing protein n=1 Tax=Hebeloma cylindrosporum TaxID=76867 RepID=A0A0C3BZA7_HEBCY|nr:hypothetical protein M413DRAFT_20429 [Hebeloma cylindrosporum h7]